jgi:DNA-binding transcriptional LysR family regulator
MNAKADFDLNDVALLVRVVQTRSFSAAARERGVSVSTVSRRISRLESALGTRLLERTTRSLHLTDAGRDYFEHAARAMDELAQGTGQLRERQAEPKGRVRILAPTWFSGAVSNVLHGYLEKYPRVSIDLELDQRVVQHAARVHRRRRGEELVAVVHPIPSRVASPTRRTSARPWSTWAENMERESLSPVEEARGSTTWSRAPHGPVPLRASACGARRY